MKVSRIAAIFGVILCPEAVLADMIVPGFKRPQLAVVIDNLSDFPEYYFYFVPPDLVEQSSERWERLPQPVMPGEPYFLGYEARMFDKWILVAVPRQRIEVSQELSLKVLLATENGVFHSNHVELSAPESVLELNPMDYEVHHFRIEMSDRHLSLTLGQVEQHSNGFSSWVPAIVVTVAMIAFGLLITRRWRRKRIIS